LYREVLANAWDKPASVEILGVYRLSDSRLGVDFASPEGVLPATSALNEQVARGDNRYGLRDGSYVPNFNGDRFWTVAAMHRCRSGEVLEDVSIHDCYRACGRARNCRSFSYSPDRRCVTGESLCAGLADPDARIYGVQRDVPSDEDLSRKNGVNVGVNSLIVLLVIGVILSAVALNVILRREAASAARLLQDASNERADDRLNDIVMGNADAAEEDADDTFPRHTVV